MSLQWIVVLVHDATCRGEVPVRAVVTQSNTGQHMRREKYLVFIFPDAANEFPKGTGEMFKLKRQTMNCLLMNADYGEFGFLIYMSEPRISLLTRISTAWLKWFYFIFVMYARKKFSLNNALSVSFVVFAVPRDRDSEAGPLSVQQTARDLQQLGERLSAAAEAPPLLRDIHPRHQEHAQEDGRQARLHPGLQHALQPWGKKRSDGKQMHMPNTVSILGELGSFLLCKWKL